MKIELDMGKNRLKPLLFSCIWGAGLLSSAYAQSVIPEKNFVASDDARIVYMGRISKPIPHKVRFTYPGVSFLARFQGSSLQMATSPGSGSFMVEIDENLPFRIDYSKTDSVKVLAEGLPEGIHRVRIMYVIEGHELKPEFRGFYLDKGCRLAEAPELPARRIEFIGNSMTCGYGVESENPLDPFSYETENHFYTYAARTARALKAQHLVVARSGIGVYRNYGAPRSGSKDCLPAMYTQVLFGDSTECWDATAYTPDVVCVNLGTNDTSLGDYDEKLLTEGYRGFLQQLRKVYPSAKLVLLSGSMLNGKSLEDVKKAMDLVVMERQRMGDKEVYRFDMSPQTGSLGMGANYHPSMRQHQKMASELTAFLKKLMKWE
jgi:lysophospholipase L1-like esterase